MAAPSQNQHRCVFVGNIPYDATEEQLVKICEEVGPVVSFRLVTDRETGKPKGYGFCEYKDEETALSARRNLQGYEVNGRQLRVDFAENDKNNTTTTTTTTSNHQPPGRPTVDPQKQFAPNLHQPMGDSAAMSAATVMSGALGTANQLNPSLLDPLSHHLAKMSRTQLTEIISEFKAMATQDKDQARMLLLSVPSLPKALFQAQIMLGMVTPQMLQMPNIRQASPMQSIQTLPEFTPLTAQNKVQSSLLLHNTHESQVPPLPMSSSQIQRPQLVQNLVPLQPLPSLPPQSSAGLSVRSHIQPSTPSLLNQQFQPSLSQQHAGQVRPINLAYHGRQNANTQTSILIRPHFPVESYQSSSSTSFENMDLKGRVSSLAGNVRMGDDSIINEMNRPSKMMKFNDGRAPPSSQATPLSIPFQISDISGRQASMVQETLSSERQVNQIQLPSDVDSTLLQQVLNLTPEQLNSLPPDQQCQVIQLQQMLRQAT